MSSKKTAPCGLWGAAVSTGSLSSTVAIKDVRVMDDGTVVWLGSSDGKTTLMAKRPDDALQKLVVDKKISGGVGYGGGEFSTHESDVYFVADEALYVVPNTGGEARRVSKIIGDIAAPAIAPDGNSALLVHSSERRDSIILTKLDKFAWPIELTAGADFYMQPTWHPSGKMIAWVEWDHPQMPWDGTRLMMAEFENNNLKNIQHIAGDVDKPVFQPQFSPDGEYLSYIINEGERDTLYTLNLKNSQKTALLSDRLLIQPAWIQDMRVHAWVDNDVYIFETETGKRRILKVALDGKVETLNTDPYQWFDQISASQKSGVITVIANASAIPPRVITIKEEKIELIARSSPENIPPEYLSDPVAINWPAPDGTITHALFYPPANPNFTSDELPPIILNVHGGPTSARHYSFNEDAVFFNSRGYAYAELNYRGSTGYGRSFMLKLRRNWGKVDVEDSIGCINALAELGLVDPKRAAIMGGSAGGFTTLGALIQHPGFFKLGINCYGVSNLFDFMIDTHKFEERYNDSLAGVFPKDVELLKQLSPSEHLDQIKDPMLIFQGDEDPVVPKAHSDLVAQTLQKNGVPHIYKVYAGEGHGFRKIANIIDMNQAIEKALKEWLLT